MAVLDQNQLCIEILNREHYSATVLSCVCCTDLIGHIQIQIKNCGSHLC